MATRSSWHDALSRGIEKRFLNFTISTSTKYINRVKSKVPPPYVEDVTQEVFIAVIRSLHRFEQRSRFSTWLYTIVNRQIADFYRQRSRHSDPEAVSLDQVEHMLTEPTDQPEYEYRAGVGSEGAATACRSITRKSFCYVSRTD